jgi:hypothetical protein
LPTGSGFPEDILKMGARRFVTDAEFDRSGPKCFSCDEMKCQSGLGWRQPKVTPQQIDGLVHGKARDGLRRHLVRVPLLGRFAALAGLVSFSQTFVRRCQHVREIELGAECPAPSCDEGRMTRRRTCTAVGVTNGQLLTPNSSQPRTDNTLSGLAIRVHARAGTPKLVSELQ